MGLNSVRFSRKEKNRVKQSGREEAATGLFQVQVAWSSIAMAPAGARERARGNWHEGRARGRVSLAARVSQQRTFTAAHGNGCPARMAPPVDNRACSLSRSPCLACQLVQTNCRQLSAFRAARTSRQQFAARRGGGKGGEHRRWLLKSPLSLALQTRARRGRPPRP